MSFVGMGWAENLRASVCSVKQEQGLELELGVVESRWGLKTGRCSVPIMVGTDRPPLTERRAEAETD